MILKLGNPSVIHRLMHRAIIKYDIINVIPTKEYLVNPEIEDLKFKGHNVAECATASILRSFIHPFNPG